MNPDIVEVVEADSVCASEIVKVVVEAVRRGVYDCREVDEIVARHRIAAITAVRPAILEEVVAIAYDAITDGELAREVATAIRAAGRDGA
jgi:hypothetical protein